MLDEKRTKEIEKRAARFLADGIIRKEKDKRFVDFFLTNSANSFDSAKLLFEASSNVKLQNSLGLKGFNGFLWVINSSYYSMFYMARAMLEDNGIKINAGMSIHLVVFDAFIHYFYSTGKLQKNIIEHFIEAKEEAAELLGKEKAKGLVEDYYREKDKRGIFTYEMGAIAMQGKAQTSLERAKKFNEEIRKIIELK